MQWSERATRRNGAMTIAGTVIFLTAVTGMTIGLVIAGVMSMDIIKERDNDANNMVKPAAPPPPSPIAPPAARRLREDAPEAGHQLFSFTPEEEKRVLRQVQQSMTTPSRASASAAAAAGVAAK